MLVAAVVALTLARIWLVLAVCGLPHTLGEVAWVFAAMGVLGLPPLGPGASPGATLVALAGSSVGAATAAGLLLAVSSIVAVVVYAAAVASVARPRRPIRRVRAGRRVVTLDVPGFGGAPPVGRGFDLHAVAGRVLAELRGAGVAEPLDLVGHSMGAAVA